MEYTKESIGNFSIESRFHVHYASSVLKCARNAGETLKSYKGRAEKENKLKTKVTKSQHKL